MAFEIHCEQVGKRFGRQWILREFTATFRGGETIGIRGRNGSGKSTLLRLLGGQLTPSRGRIRFRQAGGWLTPGTVYRHVSWTAPYLEIVEELTIAEFLRFHFGLKPLLPGLLLADLPERMELARYRHRKLTDCSSGMRQRVLLGSALYADTPLLLLDEPTVTLDAAAVAWFHAELRTCRRARLVCIASNDAADLREVSRVVEVGAHAAAKEADGE